MNGIHSFCIDWSLHVMVGIGLCLLVMIGDSRI